MVVKLEFSSSLLRVLFESPIKIDYSDYLKHLYFSKHQNFEVVDRGGLYLKRNNCPSIYSVCGSEFYTVLSIRANYLYKKYKELGTDQFFHSLANNGSYQLGFGISLVEYRVRNYICTEDESRAVVEDAKLLSLLFSHTRVYLHNLYYSGSSLSIDDVLTIECLLSLFCKLGWTRDFALALLNSYILKFSSWYKNQIYSLFWS